MPVVYRIENKYGEGIYSNRCSSDILSGIYSEKYHPSPYKDKKLEQNLLARTNGAIQEKHRFGFNSIKQLRRWVYEDDMVYRLRDIGFVLVIITVSDVGFFNGNTQVIYDSKLVQSKVKEDLLNVLEVSSLDWEGSDII